MKTRQMSIRFSINSRDKNSKQLVTKIWKLISFSIRTFSGFHLSDAHISIEKINGPGWDEFDITKGSKK